jgi:non-ribosomal peptide synthetase component F
MQSDDGARCRDYWRERLAGALPTLDFPRHRRRAGADTHDIYNFDIDGALYAGLNALARSCGVTLFGVLLSAYEVFLMRLSGQKDIIIGVPMAGRTAPGSEGVVGHFVNLVPIRADLTGNPSFRDVVTRGWVELQNALDNQDFPFVELVRVLRSASLAGGAPLFRVTLNVIRAGDALSRLMWLQDDPKPWGALKISRYMVDYLEETHDLSCKIIYDEHDIRVKFQYSANIFTRNDMAGLSDGFALLLKSVVENPDRPVA